MALSSHFGSGNRIWLAGLAFALALGFGPVAGAATITFDLSIEFSGGQTPEGTPPFVTAMFDDSVGGANDVRLTMSTSGLVDAESAENFFFNLDPALDPALLTFTPVNVADVGATVINHAGVDLYQADGDGMFDFMFDFPPPPGDNAARFTAGETVVYDITYTGPIDVSSFNFFAASGGGQGTFLSAAQIQSIGPADDGSGWIGAVPEPATALLLGVGLAGLAAAGRRSR